VSYFCLGVLLVIAITAMIDGRETASKIPRLHSPC